MKQVEIYDYYSFGFNYRILLSATKDDTYSAFYERLKKYIDFLEELELKVSQSSFNLNRLQDDISEVRKLSESTETKAKKVDSTLHKRIIDKLEKVDNVLDAELNIKVAYLLDEKRNSHDTLLNNIQKLFAKGVFSQLPPIAQLDFEESGKCLAFDRYTACAFHALRGTEDVLKMYYEKILTTKSTDKDTWGTFENAISAAVKVGSLTPVPDEQLLLNIGSLRKFYRNKTQHPQNTYTGDESQDLFSLCIKTVNEIIADLKTRGL